MVGVSLDSQADFNCIWLGFFFVDDDDAVTHCRNVLGDLLCCLLLWDDCSYVCLDSSAATLADNCFISADISCIALTSTGINLPGDASRRSGLLL